MTYRNHYEILVDLLRSSRSDPEEGDHYHYPEGAAADTSRTPAPPVSESMSAADPPRGGGRVAGVNCGRPENFRLAGTRQRHSIAPAHRGGEDEGERTSAGGGNGVVVKKRWTGRNHGGGGGGSGIQQVSKGVASGAVVPNNLPETLLCQAFYNPAVIMIVEALLDPRAPAFGSGVDISDDESDGRGASPPGRTAGGCRGRGGGAGEGGRGTSFMAQISPPKKFFTEAMLSGDRPDFQVCKGGERGAGGVP